MYCPYLRSGAHVIGFTVSSPSEVVCIPASRNHADRGLRHVLSALHGIYYTASIRILDTLHVHNQLKHSSAHDDIFHFRSPQTPHTTRPPPPPPLDGEAAKAPCSSVASTGRIVPDSDSDMSTDLGKATVRPPALLLTSRPPELISTSPNGARSPLADDTRCEYGACTRAGNYGQPGFGTSRCIVQDLTVRFAATSMDDVLSTAVPPALRCQALLAPGRRGEEARALPLQKSRVQKSAPWRRTARRDEIDDIFS